MIGVYRYAQEEERVSRKKKKFSSTRDLERNTKSTM
jgi:hypothetical protein